VSVTPRAADFEHRRPFGSHLAKRDIVFRRVPSLRVSVETTKLDRRDSRTQARTCAARFFRAIFVFFFGAKSQLGGSRGLTAGRRASTVGWWTGRAVAWSPGVQRGAPVAVRHGDAEAEGDSYVGR